MALIRCDFFSAVLGMRTSMSVVLPEPYSIAGPKSAHPEGKYPTLYLLHGLSEDHTSWHRYTAIERYAESVNLAVVMPAVQRSFYADMRCGYKYWSFISDELPALAQAFFPLSSSREDSFVAGASMGGYGAFKLALSYPDRYVAAASLAGALDLVRRFTEEEDDHAEDVRIVFDTPQHIAGSDNDLRYLAQNIAGSSTSRPLLYQCCGTEDPLYQNNLAFKAHLDAVGLAVDYEEGPGGHTWEYWDRQIAKVVEWLPINRQT
jgi:putative tributyrin esterase